MGILTKGDIVLYNFPFSNLIKRKLRPCLVISEMIGKDIILCQITSKKRKADECSIELTQKEMRNGNLKHDSYIRCNKLFSAQTPQIAKICEISSDKYAEVTKKICEIIV